jgi:hypothetical protein
VIDLRETLGSDELERLVSICFPELERLVDGLLSHASTSIEEGR